MNDFTRRAGLREKLLRVLLLQVLYPVRNERRLMEQLNCNLLFRWFVGLKMDDAIWDATVFSKNRQRLPAGDLAEPFFDAVLKQAYRHDLLSDEHCTVDKANHFDIAAFADSLSGKCTSFVARSLACLIEFL